MNILRLFLFCCSASLLLWTAPPPVSAAPGMAERASRIQDLQVRRVQPIQTAITAKYAELGGASGFLGMAEMRETATPDGVGRYQHFKGGSIYWHPLTGAHEVHGLIRQRWAQLGWERGYLGYPMSDEIDLADGSGKVTKFQGGQLIWRRATNQVTEIKSSDLVIDWPLPQGEPWRIVQANGPDDKNDSHVGRWAYCWDMVHAQQSSGGRPFVAAARARIVHVDEGLPPGETLSSGAKNPGNVVVQHFGEGRYGSYLHIKRGSYTKRTGGGSMFSPQALPWQNRPQPNTGVILGEVGKSGTGGDHLHFCVTTAPDRGAFGPFESVPVSFRNYSVSSDGGKNWAYVRAGVPRAGQWVRRDAPKAGIPAGPQVNSATANKLLSYGRVTGQVSVAAGNGRANGAGTLTLQIISKWGEPLRTKKISIGNNMNGPWAYAFDNVPAYPGLKLAVSYSGPWDRPFTVISGESNAFNLSPNGTQTGNATLRLQHVR